MTHLACCQWNVVWEDKPANYRRAEQLLADARLPPGALVLLPEMFTTGFTMNAAAVAEPLDGPTARFLGSVAKRFGVFVQGGVVIDAGPRGVRNESLTFSPAGAMPARYAKIHLFSYAGENRFYTPGDECCAFDAAGTRVGAAICYDLRFPELFRRLVAEGAELLTLIACWPAARHEHWHTLLAARAIENQCYVAAANRCGREPPKNQRLGSGPARIVRSLGSESASPEYLGGSRIIDPWGRVLAEAGSGAEVISAEIDLEALRAYRRQFSALGDRRLGL